MNKALLFDLDGTLVDTAPSLTRMVNVMLREHDLPPLPLAQTRNLVSGGARPLLQRGFGAAFAARRIDALLARFFEVYSESNHEESRIFIDLETLFNTFSGYCVWGIVTNKPSALTEQLLATLQFPAAPGCVVCGDTLAVKKPDPAPLAHAAALLGMPAEDCVYVGDDARDAVAGRAAGMLTVTAAWGYIPPAEDYRAWNTDLVVTHPSRLAQALNEFSMPAQHHRNAS
jgi:phosphoglycolate phosphatase